MKFLSKKSRMNNTILIELINKQLEPHKVSYTDIRDDSEWFMKYTTSKEEQSRFTDWAVYYLIDNLNISSKRAEEEVTWFILEHGLALKKQKTI